MVDLSRLRDDVIEQIKNFKYEVPDNAIGDSCSEDKIRAGLAELRSSLVDPYWANIAIRDTYDQICAGEGPVHRCAIVADDGEGWMVAFDPIKDEFCAVNRVESRLQTLGIDGDSVGCFMAR